MDEETALLVELILQADLFCNGVEAAGKKALLLSDMHALSLKISQCRGVLSHLQKLYENDELTVHDPGICADFRTLVMSLMWVNFLAKGLVGLELFRKLVQIESGFTYALITRRSGKLKSEGES